MTHNKIEKIFSLSIISVFVIPLFSSQYIIHASNIPSAIEDLSASTNQLIRARDSSDTNISEKEEMAYRAKVISDALSLSLKEIESAREKLETAKFDKEDGLEKIRQSMIEWLNAQKKWFQATEERLSSEKLDLEGTKILAKEIKAYRNKKYDEEITNILNFILTIETKRLTDTASDRWNKISSDLRRIERAGLIQRGSFTTEMREAQRMINEARSLVERSFSITKKIYLSPKEKAVEAPFDKEVIIAEKIPSARDLCEAAIVNLRSSYGEFVKISSSVRRLLRLP